MPSTPRYFLPSRPSPVRLIFIGDAPSDYDVRENVPLVGPAGWIFNECLRKVGIPRNCCYLLNVFGEQIPRNDIQRWRVNKEDAHSSAELPYCFPIPGGGYLTPAKFSDVGQSLGLLTEWIADDNLPTLIFPLGGTALWTLTGQSGITRLRGTLISTPFGTALPTFHPSSCLRGSYVNRVMIQADIKRGLRWLDDPEIFSRKREVLVPTTVKEAKKLLEEIRTSPSPVSCDIETAQGLVDCVGFGLSPYRSIVIPFAKVEGHSVVGPYWKTSWEFKQVWSELKKVMEEQPSSSTDMDRMMDLLPEPKGVIDLMLRRLYR